MQEAWVSGVSIKYLRRICGPTYSQRAIRGSLLALNPQPKTLRTLSRRQVKVTAEDSATAKGALVWQGSQELPDAHWVATIRMTYTGASCCILGNFTQ